MNTPTPVQPKTSLPDIEPLNSHWEPSDPEAIEVPGLNTSAPLQDQLEQLEQLITIRLQSIDTNFARAHQILSTRILPSIRRFAVNTEPVRESARFWVSFFEQAAQVRIPTTDDLTSETESNPSSFSRDADTTQSEHPRLDTHPKSGDAFVPDGVSSTPIGQPNTSELTSISWAVSLESPLDRLDRGLKSLDHVDVHQTPEETTLSDPSMTPVRSTEKSAGKQKQQPASLLHSVLSKNIATPSASHTSPLKVRTKQKTPKHNPYIAPNTPRADWDGIVDLSSPRPSTSKMRSKGDWDTETDDEEDFLPPGMSPPVTMDFFRSARPAAKPQLQLGRTPVREAAARIGRDLVGKSDGFRADHNLNSFSSKEPSAPSLSLYTQKALGLHSQSTDRSLESMMRQVGLANHDYDGDCADNADSSDSSFDMPTPAAFPAPSGNSVDQDDSMDSFDSSDDEQPQPGVPSAAFLMISQQASADDSYDSSDRSSDSLDAENMREAGIIHPLANAVEEYDDAYDDSSDYDFQPHEQGTDEAEEPTVFGGRIAQQSNSMAGGGRQLQLLGRELLEEDTARINTFLPASRLPEVPTPTPLQSKANQKCL